MASRGNRHCANCIGTLSFPSCRLQHCRPRSGTTAFPRWLAVCAHCPRTPPPLSTSSVSPFGLARGRNSLLTASSAIGLFIIRLG